MPRCGVIRSVGRFSCSAFIDFSRSVSGGGGSGVYLHLTRRGAADSSLLASVGESGGVTGVDSNNGQVESVSHSLC